LNFEPEGDAQSKQPSTGKGQKNHRKHAVREAVKSVVDVKEGRGKASAGLSRRQILSLNRVLPLSNDEIAVRLGVVYVAPSHKVPPEMHPPPARVGHVCRLRRKWRER